MRYNLFTLYKNPFFKRKIYKKGYLEFITERMLVNKQRDAPQQYNTIHDFVINNDIFTNSISQKKRRILYFPWELKATNFLGAGIYLIMY
jgi:hypothetical protein